MKLDFNPKFNGVYNLVSNLQLPVGFEQAINHKPLSGSIMVGLDLFNDDTRPSWHISRPT